MTAGNQRRRSALRLGGAGRAYAARTFASSFRVCLDDMGTNPLTSDARAVWGTATAGKIRPTRRKLKGRTTGPRIITYARVGARGRKREGRRGLEATHA